MYQTKMDIPLGYPCSIITQTVTVPDLFNNIHIELCLFCFDFYVETVKKLDYNRYVQMTER